MRAAAAAAAAAWPSLYGIMGPLRCAGGVSVLPSSAFDIKCRFQLLVFNHIQKFVFIEVISSSK
jgi:hypothetical protein